MSEENKLLFLQITNCDNMQTASHYLEMCNGDMEQAIQLYFDTAAPHTTSAPTNNTNDNNNNTNNGDGVRAPMNFGTQRLMDFSDNDEEDGDIGGFQQPNNNRAEQMIVPGVTYGGIGGIFEEFINHQRQRVLDEANGSSNRNRRYNNNSSSSSTSNSGSRYTSDDDEDNEIIMLDSSENESDNEVGYENEDNDHDDDESDESDDNLIVLDDSDENSDEDDDILNVGANGEYDLNRNQTSKKETHNDKFRKLFAKPTDILLGSHLSFNKAKEITAREKKWLLVNIQNMNMFESMKLNRDIWSDDLIKSIIKKHFMFIQYDHYQQAAKEYMFIYPFNTKIPDSIRRMVEGDKIDNVIIPSSDNKVIDIDMEEEADIYGDRLELPSIGIIDPITGALMEHWHGGIKNKSIFIKELEMFVDKYVHNNPDAIDLLSDKEVEDKEVVVTTPVQEELQEEKEPEKHIDPDVKLFNSIESKQHTEPPTNPATTTRIQFRLFNSGKRVVRRFNKNDTVQTLFEFCKNDTENFSPDKYFQLISKENVNLIEHLNFTLEEMDLLNSSITVEEISEDDDDDNEEEEHDQ